ncbi:MAG: hypothetical protein AMS24_02440 [Chlamydiae bacterium SM23_39]|nr:MAG: hypothetical protein AMS24_02440 [Chlamydiae bacterium SM23_39]
MNKTFNIKDLERFIDNKFLEVQVDSRKIKKNGLFFAISGKKNDGHNFLREVEKREAFGVVVKRGAKIKDVNIKLFIVDDVLKSLQYLAKRKIQREKGKKIGITGSVGKTTTKEFLYSFLNGNFRVEKSKKNQNSQIGLPISILNMEKDKEIIILEMGMSKKGEMKRLREIINPDIAIITKVGLVHSENFENFFEIIKEKSSIFSKNTKLKIINFELLKYKEFFNKDFFTFSIKNPEADFFLEKKKNFIIIHENLFKEKSIFNKNSFLKIYADHLLENFLASYMISRMVGLKKIDIEKRLKYLAPYEMRFERIEKDGITYLLDCYNANVLSTIAALKNLPSCEGKKIAVLGEMKELGKFSKDCHKIIGKEANKYIDLLICLGEECRYMINSFKKKKKLFLNLKELALYLKKNISEKDLVLIKGSRALKMEKILKIVLC